MYVLFYTSNKSADPNKFLSKNLEAKGIRLENENDILYILFSFSIQSGIKAIDICFFFIGQSSFILQSTFFLFYSQKSKIDNKTVNNLRILRIYLSPRHFCP